MAYRTIIVHGWQDLLAVFEALNVCKNPLVWYFRGQADADWALEPSFLRVLPLPRPEVEAALSLEQVALSLFQSQAHLYFKPDLIDRNSWSCIAWWTLMQHYSCPTRLLDWTRSPFVAAYFAVNQNPGKDGAIWLFDAPLLKKVVEDHRGCLDYDRPGEFSGPEGQGIVYPVPGFQHSERSAAQQGVFTVATCILTNHGQAIGQKLAAQKPEKQLVKIVIPSSLKLPVLARLHSMNITAKTLFPGADGVGRAVCETLCLADWRAREHGEF